MTAKDVHDASEAVTEPQHNVRSGMASPVSSALADTLTRSDAGEVFNTEGLPLEQPERYERRGELGRGGQSIVYRAWDRHLGREVAIKELRADSHPGAGERFLREARISARLEHPNIVPVYEFGRRANGTLYCVQRLVRTRQADGKPMTLRRALMTADGLRGRLALLNHFVGACEGLAYAHAQQVLHRDVKPDNIVLGQFGETVIVDWGLARVTGDASRPSELFGNTPAATVAGVAYGTPAYMSPEQARGETTTIDERSDVWSLGAVLFEILTGRPPYLEATPMETVASVLKDEPPRVSDVEPRAPAELAAIVEKALSRDPQRRYRTADALAAEVKAWQSGLRVKVYQYSALELVRLFVTRHKLVSLVTAVAVVLIGLALGLALDRGRQQQRALAQALLQKARDAESALQWDRAEILHAAARVHDDTPQTQWSARLAEARRQPRPLELGGHALGVRAIAFSPAGDRVATGAAGGMLRVFDATSGALLAQTQAHGGHTLGVAWTRDGVLSVGEDGRAVLWSADSLTPQWDLAAVDHPVNAVALTPDGTRAVLGTEDSQALVVEVATGKVLQHATHVSGTGSGWFPIYALDVSPDGVWAAFGSWKGDVTLRRLDGLKLERTLLGHEGAVLAVRFSPDGASLATAGRDGRVRVWRHPTEAPAEGKNDDLLVIDGHSKKVYALAWSRTGAWLASGSTDRTVRVWEAERGVQRTSMSFGTEGEVYALGWSPDGKTLGVGANQPAAWLRATNPEGGSGVERAGRRDRYASSPQADVAVMSMHDGIEVFAPTTLRTIATASTQWSWNTSVAMSRDGQRVAWMCTDSELCVAGTDLRKPTRLALPPLPLLDDRPVPNAVLGMGLGPHAEWLLAGDRTGVGFLWRLDTPGSAPVMLSDRSTSIQDVDAAPDGRTFAIGDYDKTVTVWDAQTGRRLRVFTGHTHGVKRVRYSPDGRTLASVSWDNTARLWDVGSGEQRCVCLGHEDHVFGVDWLPGGRELVTASWDGTVAVWSRDCQLLGRVQGDVGRVFTVGALVDGSGLVYSGFWRHVLRFQPPGEAQARLEALEKTLKLRVRGVEVERIP